LSLFAVFKAEVEVQLHICLTLHKLACLKISARSDCIHARSCVSSVTCEIIPRHIFSS